MSVTSPAQGTSIEENTANPMTTHSDGTGEGMTTKTEAAGDSMTLEAGMEKNMISEDLYAPNIICT